MSLKDTLLEPGLDIKDLNTEPYRGEEEVFDPLKDLPEGTIDEIERDFYDRENIASLSKLLPYQEGSLDPSFADNTLNELLLLKYLGRYPQAGRISPDYWRLVNDSIRRELDSKTLTEASSTASKLVLCSRALQNPARLLKEINDRLALSHLSSYQNPGELLHELKIRFARKVLWPEGDTHITDRVYYAWANSLRQYQAKTMWGQVSELYYMMKLLDPSRITLQNLTKEVRDSLTKQVTQEVEGFKPDLAKLAFELLVITSPNVTVADHNLIFEKSSSKQPVEEQSMPQTKEYV